VGNQIQIAGAGTAVITASQAGNAGYFAAADVSRTLTVNKANLTIKVNDTSKNQGQDNPQFTFTYSGFVAGDTATNLLTQPSVVTLATINSPAGYYTITPEAATSNNYDFTYIAGRLTIFPPTGNGQQFFNAYQSNSNTVTVNVFSKEAALGDIIIYDILGRQIVKKNIFIPVGFISTILKIYPVTSGTYVIAIRGNGVDLAKKIQILK
jgi:hypothetical protein